MKNNDLNSQTVHWESGTNIILGIWLFIAPMALNYASLEAVMWNDMVIGGAIAVLALIRTAAPMRFEGLSWINFVLGGWLVVAPFLLGYSDRHADTAFWNDITVGIFVLILAGSSAATTHGARSE